MSNLEKLVPPLELCKQIPNGEFADSALVWDNVSGYGCTDWHVCKRVKRKVQLREFCVSPKHADVPAPTVEEILDDLPDKYIERDLSYTPVIIKPYDMFETYQIGYTNSCFEPFKGYRVRGDNLAEAALRLWFKVKGIEVKE